MARRPKRKALAVAALLKLAPQTLDAYEDWAAIEDGDAPDPVGNMLTGDALDAARILMGPRYEVFITNFGKIKHARSGFTAYADAKFARVRFLTGPGDNNRRAFYQGPAFGYIAVLNMLYRWKQRKL